MPSLPIHLGEQIRRAAASTHAIAMAAGVSAQCVRRLLLPRPFREWRTIEKALGLLGIDLVADDGDGAEIVFSAGRRPPLPLRPVTPARSSDDGLMELIAGQCRTQRINANQLHRRAGIPYACARRLVSGRPMRVSVNLQRLLSALGIALIAIDGHGRSWTVAQHGAEPELGELRREAQALRQRRLRLHPDREADPRRRGRLQIDKSLVVELHRRYRLSYAETARLAGVSRHRVGQIVRLFERHQAAQSASAAR